MNIVSHLADTRTFLPFVHMRIYRTFARSYFTFSCPHKSLPAHIISWENDKDKDTYAFLVFPHRLFPGKVFKPLKRICATHPSHKINVYVLYNAVHNSTQGNDLPSGKSLASYWRGNEGVNRWLSIYVQQHYWLCNAFAAGMCDVYNIFRHVVIWDHCGCFGKHFYLYETNSITQLALSGQLVLTSI